MSVKSLVSSDAFISVPDSVSRASPDSNPAILFFISGNPGLIGYYHTFLSLLSEAPSAGVPEGCGIDTSQCVLAGYSLGGFELEEQKPLHSLQDQIDLTCSRIRDLATSLKRDLPGVWTKTPRVVLVGHSVGAFIALEVVRLWHERWGAAAPDPETLYSTGSEVGRKGSTDRKVPYEITGAILLTPTILDIAKSSSGRIATPLLNYIPFLPRLMQTITSALAWTLSESQVRWLVQKVTGMPDPALGTTVAFLRSRAGVVQALGMAKEELREMAEDRWGEEVWGAAAEVATSPDGLDVDVDATMDGSWTRVDTEGKKVPPKLILYFAASDHWVADATRDEILRARGSRKGKSAPVMVVEEEGKLVHGWCIAQSAFVAGKVRGWVREILQQET